MKQGLLRKLWFDIVQSASKVYIFELYRLKKTVHINGKSGKWGKALVCGNIAHNNNKN